MAALGAMPRALPAVGCGVTEGVAAAAKQSENRYSVQSNWLTNQAFVFSVH